jgi:2-hydroxy-6-oxonona-2,4-dienedioate hydrolase
MGTRGSDPTPGLLRHRAAEDALWAAHDLSRTERRVSLRRLGIDVRIQEVGEGPILLFVPGLVMTGSVFVPLVAHLRGFRCVLLDRPGTSEAPSIPMTGRSLVPFGDALIIDVLDALEIDRGRVVGASLGGSLTLIAAAGHPDRFDRIVLLGCPVLMPGMVTPAFFRLLCTAIGRRLGWTAMSSPRGFAVAARLVGHGDTVADGRLPPGIREWVATLARDTTTLRDELASLGTMASLRGVYPYAIISPGMLASVVAPTVLYRGAADPFAPLPFVERVAGYMADATVVSVASGGHMPWLDDPRRAAAAVRDHLGIESPIE